MPCPRNGTEVLKGLTKIYTGMHATLPEFPGSSWCPPQSYSSCMRLHTLREAIQTPKHARWKYHTRHAACQDLNRVSTKCSISQLMDVVGLFFFHFFFHFCFRTKTAAVICYIFHTNIQTRSCSYSRAEIAGVPGGLVGGPRAYQDQFRGFKSHRVHARKGFFLYEIN